MVMCICVRGPTLAHLATVLVLLSIGKLLLYELNTFREAHVIKRRGALGTGFTYATVLLFELLPSEKCRASQKKRQPVFRRDLAEQITESRMPSQIFLHRDVLNYSFPASGAFVQKFHENSKIS